MPEVSRLGADPVAPPPTSRLVVRTATPDGRSRQAAAGRSGSVLQLSAEFRSKPCDAESPRPQQRAKKLGRVHIGLEGDYLRVGKQYCQVLSLVEPPRGTRPDLWGGLIPIDCEMVVVRSGSESHGETRSKATAVENAIGMAGGDIWSATIGGYNPMLPPPKRAANVAQEKKVEDVGGVLTDLEGHHYYGHWSLFLLVHSRDKQQIEAALPRIQNIFSDPSEAGLLEEKRGAVSAYVSCFPGQQYNVRKVWLRGDQKADLSFLYAPFAGFP